MKKIILSIAVLFMMLPFIVGNAQNLQPGTVKSIKESCVFIKLKHKVALTGEEFETSGSGFFINENGLIATNYHVVQPGLFVYSWFFPAPILEIRVYVNSGSAEHETFFAYVAAVDKENDLAILAPFEARNVNPLSLYPSDSLYESLPIWVFGYPFGEKFTVLQRGPEISISNGTITALRHDDLAKLTSIQVNANVNHGNSGGPLVTEEGYVAGIINIAGESNMNFAVPALFLDSLLKTLPDISFVGENTDITISCNEAGTSVFLDSMMLGTTPLPVTPVKKGMHNLLFQKDGFHTLVMNEFIAGPVEINADMKPIQTAVIVFSDGKHSKALPPNTSINITDTIFSENFSDQKSFREWEQYTGGTTERTWFLEDGQLQQFENNGVLHAIYLGDNEWDNYRMDAKLKILTDGNDSRAGIIFRETGHGFCLLRLHKESNKVQLAYHSKKPFGWFIIKEVLLEEDITDKWYRLYVISADSVIACFLEDKCLINETVPYPAPGRVGFYSVESKAAFDDLAICNADMNSENNFKSGNSLLSFWYSDNFNFDSDSWFTFNRTQKIQEPWLYCDYSCAQTKKDDDLHSMTFKKYLHDNFTMQLDISFGDQTDNSLFELYFREKDGKKLSICFNKDKKQISLSEYNGANVKLLKKEKLSSTFFQSAYSFLLLVNKEEIRLTSGVSDLLEFKGKGILTKAGEFGFAVSGQTMTLYRITVASPREE
ncbi:MAG: trypsin-like peptidase domain-containing protein [Bacteroidota bacterium]